MASINYAAREISVKIVYYGPGLSGKTTNLQIIHRKIPQEHKSDMVSLATETDRTLFFDFLPLDLGTIKGFSTKFQLYTVPGQVYYNATRKLVLRGVDGVVFVADSAADKMPENFESFQNLEDNLAEYHYKREEIPIIIQYNKRDLPNALSVDELQQQFNKYGLPWTEAVANKGIGVFDSLKLMGKIVIDGLNRKYSRLSRGAATGSPSQAAAPSARSPQQTQRPLSQQPPYPQQPQQQQYQQPPYQQQPQQQQYQQPTYQQQPQQQQYQQPTYPQQPQRQQYQQPPSAPFMQNQPATSKQETLAYTTMPQSSSLNQGQQLHPSSIPGKGLSPQQSAAPLHISPKGEHQPISRQQSFPSSPSAFPSNEGQQQYGFVNFEQLPIEPALTQQPLEVEKGNPVPQTSDKPMIPENPAPGPELKQQPGNIHSVSFPQKQRTPSPTQMDIKDYSAYQADSPQQSTQQSAVSNDTNDVEDSDIRKLNVPPGKQQKGFLSKFFNREEQ
jgi:mutual gliding-motility protein MglA